MRRDGTLLALSVAAGIAVAAAVTLLQDPVYRADASIVLARQGQPPGSDPALADAAEAAAELFDSRAVAESAVANLRLEESPDELLDRVEVDADAGGSLVRVTVEAGGEEEARRTAQEVVEVATVLYNDRFGPGTTASIWEAPRADDERVSPDPLLNLLLGALGGALVGRLVAGRLRLPTRRRRPQAPASPAERPPAAAPGAPRIEQARPVPPAHVLPPPAPPQAPPEPKPVQPFVRPRMGSWTVGDVERLLAEQGPSFPERREEFDVYLASFRQVADEYGGLPPGVELVVEDVFEDLIARAARR